MSWPIWSGSWAQAYRSPGGHWASRVVTPATEEPLTADALNLRARVVAGDEEDQALVDSYIKAAREQVERDTGYALPEQEIEVAFDALPYRRPLVLPWPPLQAVLTATWTDPQGNAIDLDPATDFAIDTISAPARLWFIGSQPTYGASWPTRPQPLVLRLKVGYATGAVPELLTQAVGLLAGHYLTAGRDRTVIGTSVVVMPAGYEDAIAAYRLVEVI